MNYKFSKIQLKQIAEISNNLGVLTIGATIIPNIFNENKFDTNIIIAGLIMSFTFWISALYLLQQLKS